MTHTPPATCARGCRNAAGEREPVIGKSQLCGRCHRQFPKALTELGDLWPALMDSQIGSARPSSTGKVQSSNRIDAGQLWRPQVTGILAETQDWVGYICRQIDADPRNRAGTWPDEPRVVLYALARPQPSRYLTHTHELAPSFVDEALRLRHRAHGALNSEYVTRHTLPDATCSAPVVLPSGTETVCGAPLVGTIEPADNGRESAIRCAAHPSEHKIRPDQWNALAEHLEELRSA